MFLCHPPCSWAQLPKSASVSPLSIRFLEPAEAVDDIRICVDHLECGVPDKFDKGESDCDFLHKSGGPDVFLPGQVEPPARDYVWIDRWVAGLEVLHGAEVVGFREEGFVASFMLGISLGSMVYVSQ